MLAVYLYGEMRVSEMNPEEQGLKLHLDKFSGKAGRESQR